MTTTRLERITTPAREPVCDIHHPAQQTLPVVVASPHSGRWYPPALLQQSRLDPLALRKSEDAFVDRLFADAPDHGIPLLTAQFPRAFVDVNREAWEVDPEMFRDPDLPAEANPGSPRVTAGLGTIPKVVAPRQEIYRGKLPFAEAERRIAEFYLPFHTALERLIAGTCQRFGLCLLIDAHSMPSALGSHDREATASEIVLGDLFGSSSDRAFVEHVARYWRREGLRVGRNAPYAGGFITRHYGRPGERRHAVQLEFGRALYMDEERLLPLPGFSRLRRQVSGMLADLGELFSATRLVAE